MVNHVQNSVYHVYQRGQPRSTLLLPRLLTWSTTFNNPFTPSTNVVNHVNYSFYHVYQRGPCTSGRGQPRLITWSTHFKTWSTTFITLAVVFLSSTTCKKLAQLCYFRLKTYRIGRSFVFRKVIIG